MQLTADNYYSVDANLEYFTASQVKAFLNCEASALAEIRGEYVRPDTTALLVGSFVDSYFDGIEAHAKFIDEHPEIRKRDGEYKAEYQKALEMCRRANSDKLFREYMDGEKQPIFTGEIAGIPFKGKFDVYVPSKRIVDLKTVKDFEPMYKPGEGRMDFASYWNWPLQMAIYQRLEGNHLPCYLAVITKQEPAAIDIIEIDQARLDAEIEYLESILPRMNAIKQGIIEPERCEKCAYCRGTRKLTGPTKLLEIIEGELQ